jgi:hypothetical protein
MHEKAAEVWPVSLKFLIYICGKIFCTRYLFMCVCYACKVVMQINGLSVKSWSQKGHLLCIFSCSVECIFCCWKFGMCVWPICAKVKLFTDSLSIIPCNGCEMYIFENMFFSISDSYTNCRTTSVLTPKGKRSWNQFMALSQFRILYMIPDFTFIFKLF